MDLCAEVLASELGCDLLYVLYSSSAEASFLNQTWIAQPALFALEYSLAKLWMSWGVLPESMIGHSIGEYVAACLAEVFSLEDGLRLVAARARMMNALPAGGMLGVQLPPEKVRAQINGHLSLAAINTPASCTVAGPQDAIADLRQWLDARGIGYRQLPTSHAFHSLMTENILEPFRRYVRSIQLSKPRLPFVSNVTGRWIQASEATDPSYWALHLRQTVRFADGIRELAANPKRILLEIGPGHTLASFAKDSLQGAASCETIASLPQAGDSQPDTASLLHAMGQLWLAGAEISWNGVHQGERLHRVSLPTSPFERQRFWADPEPARTQEPGVSQTETDGSPGLPLYARPSLASAYCAPNTRTQRILAEIWKELLGIDRVGADDDFFALGGHSLLATGILARTREVFGVTVPLRKIFDAPTIRLLSDQIEALLSPAAGAGSQ
jgi:acyl transferase domain-containing protein